jgi:F-type H+-transporting ATPase subunit b
LARALREEAKSVLASYERKQKEVAEQTERIISTAKEEAMAAAKQAKADLKKGADKGNKNAARLLAELK